MLAELTIENLGVIPSAHAELSPGLTVLTGETGAGKTMVVTGLRLLAGARAEASRIRDGASRAVVEGRFVTAGMLPEQAHAAQHTVTEAGGQADENGEFIASRTVSASGRSRAHLGGRSVPAATLTEFTDHLLTIHGQNDQLRLLSPAEQLAALDQLDPRIAKKRASYDAAYAVYAELARDLSRRTQRRRELAQEIDRLTFALNEIDEINPVPGEDEELVALVRRLSDADSLREQATAALAAIDGAEAFGGMAGSDEDAAASTLLGQAAAALSGSEDPELAELAGRLEQLTATLGDVSAQLGAYLSGLPDDQEALEAALNRQQELKTLTRKYAPDAAGVVRWRDKARTRLERIDVSQEALDELRDRVREAKEKMTRAATALSTARAAAAKRLEKAVTAELAGLAMPHAHLRVALSSVEPGPSGADAVEFLLAPTPQATARPLATAASGGELSRVMLALEVIVAGGMPGATLVFDEVDAGVGGKAAIEIGRRLARLATNNQVIAVTHLPQVAAYADVHLHVSKAVSSQDVRSGVRQLSGEDRVEELARMLAGMDDTATGRAHAAELLAKADSEKTEQRSSAST
ncbi:DNA repair protein RecN [Corynebacterium uberis]|uniref:DNA repair protein RecN n=1 Tax=Corynebacterium TaxID=1716 RepID=UPI001D0AC7A4|nr:MULTISPECIES: DNA repair protein RecN [Corynebacterium]MCZ9308721.1 DNA repair protein RecN [Corynebacterium sp. c6VSa_13]UDL74355.1 DNA repair protein RecN [Corynebacterium uberis]UDL76812.1 DNA repair protein RecN [Corynebacterium uberis]UDL79025.1 DNA repair protein RecN [Corynebacterium uberis]UDL79263.1 DNA repair protein RecN [Corynebacterium uberis]